MTKIEELVRKLDEFSDREIPWWDRDEEGLAYERKNRVINNDYLSFYAEELESYFKDNKPCGLDELLTEVRDYLKGENYA